MNTLLRLAAAVLIGSAAIDLHASGFLTDSLSPSSAVSAGAKWRVDSGGWLNSGATVKVSAGTHQVSYASVAGWIAPSSTSVSVLNSRTTALSATYVQRGGISVTLAPSSAQWQVDNGAWQASGATVANLAPGSHTVAYSSVTGYIAPSSESVTVTGGQTLSFSRTYTMLASLTVTLDPSTAQWRVDGGAWMNSGDTVGNLALGNHTIDYAAVDGYQAPASETVALASGANTLSRSYVLLASLTVTLSPSSAQWRIDGGAWQASGATTPDLAPGGHTVDYLPVAGYLTPASETLTLAGGSNSISRAYVMLASLTVTLSPNSAQWRLDGGPWQASGATLANLVPGAHTLDYAPLAGWVAPSSESINLASGGNTVSRSYVQLASLTVTLTPGSATWRVDGGAWQGSGVTVNNLAQGAHTVDFSAVSGYFTPSSQTVNLVGGSNTVSVAYTPQPTVTVTLSPTFGQWRIDAGPWQSSGASSGPVSAGGHTIDFSAVDGYFTPASQTVNLVSGPYTFSYTYVQAASLTANLTPSNAQWRLDGGTWNATSATLNNLTLGSHIVDFAPVDGYITPASQTVNLVSGSNTVSATYTPLASLTVTTTPNYGQWRLDGGTWNMTSTTLNNLSLGTHTIDFAPLDGYITPASQTVNLVSGSNSASATYTPLASLTVSITPDTGQWRIDGGAWNSTYTTLNNLSLGTHTIDFAPLQGYITPDSQTVTLVSGTNSASATYTPMASLTVTLTPTNAQWRIDGGAWNSTYTTLNNLSLGVHTVDFSSITGYVTPDSQTVNLVSGSNSLSATYTPLASLNIDLHPDSAFWRIDGGTWQYVSTTLNNLSLGAHTIDYSTVPGYVTPPSETVTLVSGSNSLARSYTIQGPLYARLATFFDAGTNPGLISGLDGSFYGFANADGGNRGGAVFQISADGGTYTILTSMMDLTNQGLAPTALLDSADGHLYGTTTNGGTTSANGTVYRLNHDGTDHLTLVAFNDSHGIGPNALIEGVDGRLYGTAPAGGAGNDGIVFVVGKDGTGLSVLKAFSGGSDGQAPIALIQGSTGTLYGVLSKAGANSLGGIFSVNPDGSGYTVLHAFAGGPDGASPRAGLLLASDGALYGTTGAGGTSNHGTVYRLNTDGSGYSVLKSFPGDTTDGGLPMTPLTEDGTGTLYGTTASAGSGGAGTVFKLNKDGTGYIVLQSFTRGVSDGGTISGTPLIVRGMVLYGVNRNGGSASRGRMFSLNTDGTGFTGLQNFGAAGGTYVLTSVIEGTDGKLYGSAYAGGSAGAGAYYQMNADGSSPAVIYNIPTGTAGNFSQGLTDGGNGILYGAVGQTVFLLTKGDFSYFALHTFTGTDGSSPQGVIHASDWNLYGTTSGGGANGAGTVFSLNGSTLTTLYSFGASSTDGKYPYATVTEGADGRLYGTTSGGGSSGSGTVFVINKDGTGYAVLKQFSGGTTDGSGPWCTIAYGDDGRLYGTTSAGGAAGLGTVFTLNPDGSGYTVLHGFAGGPTDGANPNYAGVVERNGVLYGTASTGGTFNRGVAYQMNADGTGFTILVNFGVDETDGTTPAATLTSGTSGALWGTTATGGRGATVFRILP